MQTHPERGGCRSRSGLAWLAVSFASVPLDWFSVPESYSTFYPKHGHRCCLSRRPAVLTVLRPGSPPSRTPTRGDSMMNMYASPRPRPPPPARLYNCGSKVNFSASAICSKRARTSTPDFWLATPSQGFPRKLPYGPNCRKRGIAGGFFSPSIWAGATSAGPQIRPKAWENSKVASRAVGGAVGNYLTSKLFL